MAPASRPAPVEAIPLPGRSRVRGNAGAVTAMSRAAARVGAGILEGGGNAVDAAVATALASGVVEPAMSGLGGTAYALVAVPGPDTPRVTAIEGSARCPGAAREDLFEPLGGVGGGLYGFPPTKGDRAETGALSALVPTAPAVLAALHARFGRLSFGAVAEPAIALAEDGFVPDWVFAVHAAAGFRRLRRSPGAFPLYTRADGSPFVPTGDHDRLRLPDLAAALRRLAADGPEPFYQGDLARRLGEGVRDAGGILDAEDFAEPAAREIEPLRVGFRGRDVLTLPANSGGPTLAAALAHLDALGDALPDDSTPADEADFLHVAAEALRLAFTDRFRWLGDPESIPVPLPGLLDPAYLAARRSGVEAGGPRIREPAEPVPPGAEGAPGRSAATGGCTTHLNVLDGEGMAVAFTATLGGRFGSAFAVPGTGYPLNNGMMWFDPRPGRRISPAPGRRALHAAAPAIILRDGRLAAAAGSPGGRRLISAVAMTLARFLGRGLPMPEAANGPGFHADTGSITLDERTPAAGAVARALEARGHRVEIRAETALTGHFGRPSGIGVSRGPDGSWFEPGVDPVRTASAFVLDSSGERTDRRTVGRSGLGSAAF